MNGKRFLLVALVVVGLVGLCALARGESADVLLERAVYAEETVGDLDQAISLYRQTIEQAEENRAVLARAHYRLASCYLKKGMRGQAAEELEKVVARYPDQEQIAARARDLYSDLVLPDPASLMPAETLMYYEVGSPGEQVEKILGMLRGSPLENPLEVFGTTGSPGGRSPQNIAGALLNPSMIEEFKKVRGLAVGITELRFDGPPAVVAALYPGESDALRGVILMAVNMAGQKAEPLQGMQRTLLPPGPGVRPAFAYDDNVMIFATGEELLAGAVRRYKGDGDASLATGNPAFTGLDRSRRSRDAVTFWANVAGIYPALRQQMIEEGKQQELAGLETFADPESIRNVIIRDVIDARAPYTEVIVNLAPDHHALAYNLVRTPQLQRAGFAAVPPGAVALASFALGELPQDSPKAQQVQNAVMQITGQDIARELFANIGQINLFVMPPAEADADSVAGRLNPILPGVGAVVTSRDPATTRRLLSQVLGAVDAMVGGQTAQAQPQADELRSSYRVRRVGDEFLRCHVEPAGPATVLALSPGPVQAVQEAVRGASALTDGPLSSTLAELSANSNKLVVVDAQGLINTARGVAEAYDAPENQLRVLGELADAIKGATFFVQTQEEPARLVLRQGVRGMPPLAGLIPLVAQLQATGSRQPVTPAKPPAPQPVEVPYSAQPIAVDGDLSEWADIAPMPLPHINKPTSSVRMCWRQEGLYAAVQTQDGHVWTNESMPWTADSFELFVDKLFARNEWQGPDAEQYIFSPTESPGEGPNKVHVLVAWGASQGKESLLRGAWLPTDGGYAMEVFVPADVLAPANMQAGHVMGLNFALNNDGHAVEQFYCDKDSQEAYARPMLWGAVKLAAAPVQ
ncbi:MAG: sugar-binding protein [Candidatus Brocadiia bacterium]